MSSKRGEIEAVSIEEIEEAEKTREFGEKVEPTEKTSTHHVEYSRGDTKKPYWDTAEVVGANRHLHNPSFNSADEVVVRKGFFRRRWLHVKRYWMLYGGAGFIGLAAGLPLLFLVIFPAIAQRIVDNANLPIHTASIMNPTPTSVVYSLLASLKVPAGITVDLKPLQLSLFTAETGPSDPYIKVDLPEYHLRGKTNLTIVNQTATILDQPQFEKFLASAVSSEEFTMSAAGSTTAYLGKLKAPLKLNKNVKLAGLNNLTGFGFLSAAAVFPPMADGTNLVGTVNLPNPSIVTFELCNVTLNMIVGGLIIGNGRLQNVVLSPGNNTLSIKATVDLKTAIQNLPIILLSQANALKSGNLEVSASGNSTICNGQHIPYYETVLNKLVVTAQLPVIQLLIDSLSGFLNTSNLTSILSGAVNSTDLLGILAGLSKNSTLSTALSTLT